jgi:protein SCO1/2
MIILYIYLNISPIQLKNGIYIKHPQTIAPFTLVDNRGNTYTEKQLDGNWSLLFFGFSSCPMICPVILDTLQQVNEHLPESNKMNIIFVTVDPEHDTVQHLNKYMQSFDNHFVALRGEMSAINALQKQLHVAVSTTPSSHGTEIILINPQGELQAYFNYGISSQALLQDLNKITAAAATKTTPLTMSPPT